MRTPTHMLTTYGLKRGLLTRKRPRGGVDAKVTLPRPESLDATSEPPAPKQRGGSRRLNDLTDEGMKPTSIHSLAGARR